MQQRAPAASTALAPGAIQVAFRSSGGDGSRVFVVEAPARSTVADVKRLLCRPPHSLCSDASALELVLKGEGAAVARAPLFALHLTLWRAGCILRDGAALASAAATHDLIMTAVVRVCGSPRAPSQPQSTCAARAPPAHRAAPSVPAPTAIDVANNDAAGIALSPPASSAAIVMIDDESAPSSPVKAAAPSPAPAAATVHDGSRVRIEGLQAKPQHNGRLGVVCGGFDDKSGRWTVAVDASDAGPAFQISIRPTNLAMLPGIDLPQRPSEPATSANTCTPPSKAVQHGSRVRIEGLEAKPHMNGRTGVVCGAFDVESGRWTVDVAADGARPACRGSFRAGNLRLIPSHNFSTEWVDEGGRVWPKNVDFSRQCAKGHALAPLGERGGLSDKRLMCRLCHCLCERGCDESACWLMCSEDAGCCGEYAVCCSCARLPSAAAAAACAGADDFRTQVMCSVLCFV
jgi:hypothetical protein